MIDFDKGARCERCAFWIQLDDEGGSCRRRAPYPSNQSSEIVHWPRTHRCEFCGEWQADSGGASALISCRDCLFWRHLAPGSVPVDKLDQRSAWWRGSGHCQRRAPTASAEPGNRSFWPTTHESDACAEGAPGISRETTPMTNL
jgi:hypothetical protein